MIQTDDADMGRGGGGSVSGTQLNGARPQKDLNARLTHAMTSLTQRQVRELQLSSERKRQEAKASA